MMAFSNYSFKNLSWVLHEAHALAGQETKISALCNRRARASGLVRRRKARQSLPWTRPYVSLASIP